MARLLMNSLVALTVLTPWTSLEGGEVYVGARTLYVIDEEGGKITASIPVEKWIYNITVSRDGEAVYIGASNGVNIIDLERRSVEGLMTDQPGFTVKIDDDSHRMYVLTNDRKILPDGRAEALPSKVLVYDLRDRGLLRTIELNRIVFDIEVVPELDRLYCLDILESELKIVQLTSGAAIETIELGGYGLEHKDEIHGFLWRMTRRPGGDEIYIPQGGDHSGVLIVDTSTNSVRRVSLGHEAKWRGSVLSPDGKRLYLNAVRNLSVIDLDKEAEIAWRPLDVPYQGLAIDRSGRKLYLVNPIYEGGGSVATFDASTLDPISRVLVPDASPFTIAVSPVR